MRADQPAHMRPAAQPRSREEVKSQTSVLTRRYFYRRDRKVLENQRFFVLSVFSAVLISGVRLLLVRAR